MILLYLLNFFTTWLGILTVFHEYVAVYISLPFLSFVVMTMGLYFSYINPGKFVIHNIELKDPHKVLLIDLVFHIGIFIFVIYTYGLHGITDRRVWAALALLAVYNLVCHAPDIYKVEMREIIYVFAIVMVLYILLSFILGIY